MKKLIEITFGQLCAVDGIFKEDPDMKCITIHLDKEINDKDGKRSKQFFIHNDEPIRDVPAYLGVYFSRLLETNKDMKSICVDGVTFELKAIPTTYEQAFYNGYPIDDDAVITISVSGGLNPITESLTLKDIEKDKTLSGLFSIERAEMPIKKKNGVPRFVSSDLMNQILFHSGANIEDSKAIRKLIGKNMKIMPKIANALNSVGLYKISKYNLKYLISIYKNWDFNDESSYNSLKESIQNLTSNDSKRSKITGKKSVIYGKSELITLKHEWF